MKRIDTGKTVNLWKKYGLSPSNYSYLEKDCGCVLGVLATEQIGSVEGVLCRAEDNNWVSDVCRDVLLNVGFPKDYLDGLERGFDYRVQPLLYTEEDIKDKHSESYYKGFLDGLEVYNLLGNR